MRILPDWKWVRAKRLGDEHHMESILVAREAYDSAGEGRVDSYVCGEMSVITAAGPDRIAWEAYFYHMRSLGEDAWLFYDNGRYDRDLKR